MCLASVADAEPTAQSGRTGTSTQSVFSSLSKPKAIAKMTQAKVLAERHHVSRNAIQRQNRVRQGVQHHSYHLQQPGCRSLSHWISSLQIASLTQKAKATEDRQKIKTKQKHL